MTPESSLVNGYFPDHTPQPESAQDVDGVDYDQDGYTYENGSIRMRMDSSG
jgi:hypothetical protein